MTIEELYEKSGKEYLSFDVGKGIEMLNVEQLKKRLGESIPIEPPVKPEIAEEKLAEEMAEEVADVMMNFDENINYNNILNSWKAYFINKLKEKG